MKEKLNKILKINLILSLLPLVLSVVINLCVLFSCMLGEEITNVDGYQSMGVMLLGGWIYLPLWLIATLVYIILGILVWIFTSKALNSGNEKERVFSANKTVNIYSYVMLVLILVYGIFIYISLFALMTLYADSSWALIFYYVGRVFSGIEFAFGVVAVVHTTYISKYKSVS